MIVATIHRAARVMESGSLILGGVCLFYMVCVVGLNVLARIVFDSTGTAVNLMIPGAIEQVSYLLGVVAMAGLTASLSRGMIAVDFLVTRLPKRGQIVLARFWFLVLLALALVLCWLFYEDMLSTHGRGEESQDLRLPMALIYGMFALQSLALMVVALREMLSNTGEHGEIS